MTTTNTVKSWGEPRPRFLSVSAWPLPSGALWPTDPSCRLAQPTGQVWHALGLSLCGPLSTSRLRKAVQKTRALRHTENQWTLPKQAWGEGERERVLLWLNNCFVCAHGSEAGQCQVKSYQGVKGKWVLGASPLLNHFSAAKPARIFFLFWLHVAKAVTKLRQKNAAKCH